MPETRSARRQCAHCPWKVGVDPLDIPGEYSVEKHRALAGTIREGAASLSGPLRIMACHETAGGAELPCVGWLHHQLGPGNNIGLRLAVMHGRVNANVRVVGRQHRRFEDTLPGGRDVR